MERIDILAKILWDYHHMNQTLKKSDVILTLGSSDIRVAERSAEIFLSGYAPLLIFSGGLGRITKDTWKKPEAEVFADVAIKMGVPKEKILIESNSQNTGENISFTKKLLLENNLNPKTYIIVNKSYMERRTYATIKKQWPEIGIVITSPQISYEEYPNESISKELFINIMVGDIQRIKEYPSKGYQIHQDIPDNVWNAYEELVKLGFNKQLLKN